jgi:hypothetical protein
MHYVSGSHPRSGLTDRSRRPERHANQQPVVVEQQIVGLKKEYPSWGAPKIRERLRQRNPDVACPAISTVHAVLDRHGLISRARLTRPLGPNALWCADPGATHESGEGDLSTMISTGEHVARSPELT